MKITVVRWFPGDDIMMSCFTVLPCLQIMVTSYDVSFVIEFLFWQFSVDFDREKWKASGE